MLAYNRIPVEETDVANKGTTPAELFEFLGMLVGPGIATQTVQKFMLGVERGLDDMYVHMDDILVASYSKQPHSARLRALLTSLSRYGVQNNAIKYELQSIDVTFLGHIVSSLGIPSIPNKFAAVHDRSRPRSSWQLRRLFSPVNLFRLLFPKSLENITSVDDLLRGAKRKPLFLGRLN